MTIVLVEVAAEAVPIIVSDAAVTAIAPTATSRVIFDVFTVCSHLSAHLQCASAPADTGRCVPQLTPDYPQRQGRKRPLTVHPTVDSHARRRCGRGLTRRTAGPIGAAAAPWSGRSLRWQSADFRACRRPPRRSALALGSDVVVATHDANMKPSSAFDVMGVPSTGETFRQALRRNPIQHVGPARSRHGRVQAGAPILAYYCRDRPTRLRTGAGTSPRGPTRPGVRR